MTSLNTMIKRIAGLHGTRDLNTWETGFVCGIVNKTNNGEKTGDLSEKQIESIQKIHDKHFA